MQLLYKLLVLSETHDVPDNAAMCNLQLESESIMNRL